MQNKKTIAVLAIAILLAAASPALAAKKTKLTKAVITEIDGTTITATRNSKTYTINAERAVLKNAKGKTATLDQFFSNDQIDVNGTMDSDGIIVAKTVKDRSLKTTDLTRRNVGSDNLATNVISDLNFISNGIITEDKLKAGTLTNASIADNANISASKLNLANAITTDAIQNGSVTSDKLADGITLTTGNISTLDLGTNTITDGNFTGNWSFNDGTLSNINTLTAGTANVTTLDLGTNTVSDGSLNGNWDFNGGNLSNVGTIGSGNITTSGTVTSDGTGNNYFAGNVGVGTTAPAGKLQIATASTDGIVLTSTSTQGNIDGAKIIFRGPIGAGYWEQQGAEIAAVNESSYTRKALVFKTSDTARYDYDPKERMRISMTGNVGINDVAPNAKLSVVGNAVIGYTSGTAGPANGLAISGNVGIGTTSPAVKLDVNGEIKYKKNSAQPYACDAAHDSAVSLTNKYTTCVCKNGTGWVLTSDGTTACTWN